MQEAHWPHHCRVSSSLKCSSYLTVNKCTKYSFGGIHWVGLELAGHAFFRKQKHSFSINLINHFILLLSHFFGHLINLNIIKRKWKSFIFFYVSFETLTIMWYKTYNWPSVGWALWKKGYLALNSILFSFHSTQTID